MMDMGVAFFGCDIFDGQQSVQDHALLVKNGMIAGVVPVAQIPEGFAHRRVVADLIAPGFVDLQVNGGGGVLLNDAPTVASIRKICQAHLPFGTTSLLPTLITDTPEKTGQAIDAVLCALVEGVPGAIGLHLEGPHLAPVRKGAHDGTLVRPMTRADLQRLCAAAPQLSTLMVTVAPEAVSNDQISQLAQAGARVSLGHTDTGFVQAKRAVQAGACCVTHLFNAMSQMVNREPGLVGAALDIGGVSAGLIADGIHVDPVCIRAALRAKQGPGQVFLVTDAMATIGTDLHEFSLNGRRILRENGRLMLEDGTLAGADLDMISAVRFMHRIIGLSKEQALAMASFAPAQVIGRTDEIGHLVAGARADFLLLDPELTILDVWQGGRKTGA
jgi:N-acetylglucosamine-6-phosphate deacetylase